MFARTVNSFVISETRRVELRASGPSERFRLPLRRLPFLAFSKRVCFSIDDRYKSIEATMGMDQQITPPSARQVNESQDFHLVSLPFPASLNEGKHCPSSQ
jgi:hypothetical protein